MKHKIGFLLGCLLLASCGVEMRDKDQSPVVTTQMVRPDFEMSGVTVLAEHTTIDTDRLVLLKDTVIITQNKNLIINARELVAENAMIRNFQEGRRALAGQNGVSGGSVVVNVQKAKGNLQIILQGEGGGHGYPGVITSNVHPGCAGTSGGDGGTGGSLTVMIQNNSEFGLGYQNLEASAGLGGKRGSVPYGTPMAIHPPCAADAANGIDGKPGSKGQVCLKIAGAESFQCE